jgi:hypothetical protein
VMKRGVRTTSHTRIWVTKDVTSDLIGHARSQLLWRRCIKGMTLLSKVTTKLRVKFHLRGACIGSKRMRGIKVIIDGISLLKGRGGLLSLFPQNLEGKESCWNKGLSSLLSCPFVASSRLFSPHEALYPRHGESDTCQIEVRTSS